MMGKIKDVVEIVLGLAVLFVMGYAFGHYVLLLW